MDILTPAEIRRRLSAFAVQWKAAARENADAKLFWARFYECFGIRPESATIYEKAVEKLDGATGFIDSFIPGKLIVEHKSRGKSLDSAFTQATDYFLALPEPERPRYIITSDFARIRLYDLLKDQQAETTLKDLPKHGGWFRFLLEDDAPEIVEESPINRQAAYTISKLHESLLRANFKGRDLEVFLTRLLFCLFADHTGIFEPRRMFHDMIEATREDGRDTGGRMSELFDVLHTPEAERQSTLDGRLSAFAYVNGRLFAERTRIPAFDAGMRALLLQCANLDWSGISPAIFGAMFQGVLEAHTPDESRQATRRELGAHFTSERNILRVIDPLFMDDLRAEFAKAQHSKPRMQALYDKLPTLHFLDPACGCGNFLVIAYRELRKLENEVIAALFGEQRGLLDVSTLCRVRVSQFHGIEIDEAASHIARVALWITDHQMNVATAERFGNTRPTVPLVDTPHIHHTNALHVDWAALLPPERCSYVMGNPPFSGKKEQSEQQKADMAMIFAKVKGAGVLDYVAAWYAKALEYIRGNPSIAVAFVSTNSITQGEQVASLWPLLLQGGVRIHFAHRTFKWSNEGKGNAAVHCVIVGFGLAEPDHCTLFDYGDDPKGEGRRLQAQRINPYLVDAAPIVIAKRNVPIAAAPVMNYGSMPIDNGTLALTPQDKSIALAQDGRLAPYIRRYIGGDEFINGGERYCLWFVGADPHMLRTSTFASDRIRACRAFRLGRERATTQELAKTPQLFGEIRQPATRYLVLPKVSSESRAFIPTGFEEPDTIASGSLLLIPGATLYHLGLLSSTMHNAWMRAVCGRMKSDYQYSASIVYNNFPWPEPSEAQREAIEATGQAILDARKLYPNSTLADLYGRLSMPAELRKAHAVNDKAVDAAYGYKGDKADAARVAYLFQKYQRLTSLLPVDRPKRPKVAKATDEYRAK
ncbi:MAG: N-6 DNA methylase [Betaproteobacteria bacterium]|nr:N-6 DNA methylase [Betaproteobacteria bacterium]